MSDHPSHFDSMTAEEVENRTARLAARVILDACLKASARTWTRRAVQLEAARPRRADYTGRATVADLTARWDRLTAAANACRARAAGADGHAVLDLTHSADALVPPSDDDLVDRLEPRLRAALDAGDTDEATRLSDLIDALEGYVAPTPTTEEAQAA